jgi:hypothetical protein
MNVARAAVRVLVHRVGVERPKIPAFGVPLISIPPGELLPHALEQLRSVIRGYAQAAEINRHKQV